MRGRRVTQVRNWITLETVGTALENDEFRLEPRQMLQDARPCLVKRQIIRAGRHRNVELRACRRSLPSFRNTACSGIQIPPILVQVGKDHAGVVLKCVKDSVTVMRIDIDISNALQTCMPQKLFNDNATVVEHTKAGSMITTGMMKARNRNKRPTTPPGHDCRG